MSSLRLDHSSLRLDHSSPRLDHSSLRLDPLRLGAESFPDSKSYPDLPPAWG